MREDKAGLKWNEHQTLLEHMVNILSAAASPVRVVGRQDLPDIFPNCGPLGGILTALEVTPLPMNLIAAVDLPLLTSEFLVWFGSRVSSSTKSLVVCQVAEDFPLCFGVHRNFKDSVAERIRAKELALHRWISQSDPEIIVENEIQCAGFPLSIFHNVNTPSDWNELREEGRNEK